jgi:hypothetical protein
MRARWFCSDPVREGLASHLQDVATARRPCIQQAHPMVRPRHLPGMRTWPPPISPTSETVW